MRALFVLTWIFLFSFNLALADLGAEAEPTHVVAPNVREILDQQNFSPDEKGNQEVVLGQNSASAIPTGISKINFVTGNPLVGGGDTTGGFGDVAANIVSALAYKRNNPEAKVTVIVTSYADRIQPQIHTTNEIVKIMLPSLDASQKYRKQTTDGVDFVFTDIDPNQLFSTATTSAQDLKKLKETIPNADVSVQYSANNSPMRSILEMNSSLAFSFMEPGSSDLYISTVNKLAEHHYTLESGPTTMGYYLQEKPTEKDLKNDRALVNSWLSSTAGIQVTENTKIAYSYSKEWQASQLYIEAISKIAKKEPKSQIILVVKDFKELSLKNIPKNLRIVISKGMTDNLVKSFIRASHYSPLITGDVSLSYGISYARSNKLFVYDSPPWKVMSAEALQNKLRNRFEKYPESAGLKRIQRTLNNMFLHNYIPNELNEPKLRNKVANDLAEALLDTSSQEVIHTELAKLKRGWNINDNVNNLVRLHQLFKNELGKSKFNFQNIVFYLAWLQHHGDWNTLIKTAQTKLLDSKWVAHERIYWALLLLKLDLPFGTAESSALFESLHGLEKGKVRSDFYKVIATFAEQASIRDKIFSFNTQKKPAYETIKNNILNQITTQQSKLSCSQVFKN